MCTLALFWRVFPDAPVVVAANRDENPLRPWRDPHHWVEGIFAGRDELAGGTWLGAGPRGLVAGITNRWDAARNPPDATRRSRGLVVTDALGAASAAEAVHALQRRSPSESNGFGLLVADADAAFRVDCDGLTIGVEPLAPGITVLANWSSAERRPRSERALQLAAAVPIVSLDSAWPALRTLVSDHEGAEIPGQPICSHGDHYATVCSTLLASGRAGLLRWSDTRGNPCTSPWVDRIDRRLFSEGS